LFSYVNLGVLLAVEVRLEPFYEGPACPCLEENARQRIDELLSKAGWVVQDYKSANIHAGKGVVLRNFPLTRGHGFADYLLYLNGKAAGVIEAKKEGVPLTGGRDPSDQVQRGPAA
jgi:type I restriction enzyme R subunit